MNSIWQNFHKDCEKGINKQINMELHASYVYLSMAYHFDRHDVALPGLHKYFKKASDEEREHAMKFLKYQNKRGGNFILTPIEPPPCQDWESALNVMTEALELEKKVNEVYTEKNNKWTVYFESVSLLQLHKTAAEHNDANFMDFLETEFLQEQVDSIKEIADHITNLELLGEGLGVYVFDKELNK